MTYPGPGGHPGQQPATSPYPTQATPPHAPPVSPPQQRGPSTAPVPAQPTSPAPAQQSGHGNGYILGVDLGTSHTVAVIRWPDGRCRPLLVDGAPVMPSAVFLDESGHIHVGRDAQRLAQTDPTRFEPNPKHRIGESTVLLGDREVPVTALLSAILREVASKSVEAVGHLPTAVLTFPAKWGQQRRSVLEDAAAQAGFPPVKMVPEPVAAAHYFAEVMRQPIPAGSSVGVFDFGGGTLDIAVVRHESDGSFSVQADGGLDDLGGLDVDSALVESLGATIGVNAAQVWQQLSQPANATDRRNRRLFWDDVRGAKEMLSRTTVAPIPVPGVEASLHLTREEIEKLATPLLQRAVEETQRVIATTGQAPQQLAGLFLVGGASRMPLVARLLHANLGIAPTVLEQPELPVAEGSLAAAFPARASAAEAAQQAGTDAIPAMGGPTEGFLAEPGPPKPWYKRKSSWIGAAAVAALLGLGVGWLLYDPYPQNEMTPLSKVAGEAVAFPGGVGDTPMVHKPEVHDNIAYFPADGDDAVQVTAMDMSTGEKVWNSDKVSVTESGGIQLRNNMLYVIDKVSYDEQKLTILDMDSGKKTGSVTVPAGDAELANHEIVGDQLTVVDGKKVKAYDADGSSAWTANLDFDAAGLSRVESWSEYSEPLGSSDVEDPTYLLADDGAGTVAVIDTAEGKVVASENIGDDTAQFRGYEDKLYVVNGDASPDLDIFNLEDLASAGGTRVKDAQPPIHIGPCGETLMCVLGDSDEEGTADRLSVVDVADDPSVPWQSAKKDKVHDYHVLGDQLMLMQDKTTTENPDADDDLQVVDSADGAQVGKKEAGTNFERINSGNALNHPYDMSVPVSTAESATFEGLGADGTRYDLGTENVFRQCAANDYYLACPTEGGYQSWTFVS